MHLLVHFRRRDWSVNNLAVPPHTIKQGLYFNMPHAHGAALAWEFLLNSMGRGTIQSSFSLMKKLHQEPQQSGVIYIASDYGGDFKSQFTPRLTVLMDQIIWGSQWKTGVPEERGEAPTDRSPRTKPTSAVFVTRVDAKKSKLKSKHGKQKHTAAQWRRGELEVCWLTGKRPRSVTVQTNAGSPHLI